MGYPVVILLATRIVAPGPRAASKCSHVPPCLDALLEREVVGGGFGIDEPQQAGGASRGTITLRMAPPQAEVRVVRYSPGLRESSERLSTRPALARNGMGIIYFLLGPRPS